jgi:glycosyltransferase involved in cell wall biosynthesis
LNGTSADVITVAICTWNRADLLEQTLAQMCRLTIPPGLAWELVIVNNNSTDHTSEVADKYRTRLPIRTFLEPQQGLSHARNRAVEEARGTVILWTDDDVLVDPRWLANYSEAVRQWPEATYFGGPVHPWFAKSPPRWVRRHLQRLGCTWALLEKDTKVRPLEAAEYFFGANMAFRIEVLRQHPFDVSLGRIGTRLQGAEEIVLITLLKNAGARGVWVGNAPVRHYLPSERLTTDYLWKFNYHAGTARLASPLVHANKHWLGIPRWMLRRYWVARLTAWSLAPLKNKRWLEAFVEAARCKGAMDAYRARTALQAPADGKALAEKVSS